MLDDFLGFWVVVGFIGLSIFGVKSCNNYFCDKSECKYVSGDQVEILNKAFHDEATVTDVRCGCEYTVSYYSSFGIRRHRNVVEGEIIKN